MLTFPEGLSSTTSFNLRIFTDEETVRSEYLSHLRSPRYKRQKWDLTPILTLKPWLFPQGRTAKQAHHRPIATRGTS